MSIFKIATWNVNSLRVRLAHTLEWLQEVKPDVFALQETKIADEHFPCDAIREVGYHVIYSGERAYNGVAILSRHEPTHILTDIPNHDDPQRRVLAISMGDIRIVNLYVPNGESVFSKKYSYKLHWLQKIAEFLREELNQHSKVVVLGDFNIAPAEVDVHDPRLWAGRVLFSEPERNALQQILNLGFSDCFRQLHSSEKKFTWWDYRMNAFARNRGLRIDHILANNAFAKACTKCDIDVSLRAKERPSDHAPVVAEFNC